MTKGCLLFHGFTGGPYEMQPLADVLEEDGYRTMVPVLSGHDEELTGLKHVCHTDWLKDADRYAEQALRECEVLDVVGFSMGGLLAAYVANRYRIRRLVLIGAAIIYISPARFVQAFRDMVRERDFRYFEKAGKTPARALWQFVKLVRKLRPEFSKITVPTLIVQGEADQVVHPASARWIYQRVKGPKELLIVPGARHLVCLEPNAWMVFRAVHEFFQVP